MTDKQKRFLKDDMIVLLDEGIASDYIEKIVDKILDDVAEDIDNCADKDYSVDDIRLAIGRILIEKLGIDY